MGAGAPAWVLNLVSSPVLAGFSQAAALLIIASQLPSLLGLEGSLGTLLHSPKLDLQALAYGLVSLVLFIVSFKRYASVLPIMLDRACCGLAALALFFWAIRRTGWSWAPCPAACPRCTGRPGRAGTSSPR